MLAVLIVVILALAAALLVIHEADRGTPPEHREQLHNRRAPYQPRAAREAGSETPALTARAAALRREEADGDDGFERRPVYLEPPDPALVGFERPHLRPDPDRLIQTEVIMLPGRGGRAFALGRLIASTALIGAVVGAGAILAGKGVVSLLARFAR